VTRQPQPSLQYAQPLRPVDYQARRTAWQRAENEHRGVETMKSTAAGVAMAGTSGGDVGGIQGLERPSGVRRRFASAAESAEAFGAERVWV
jgi:hypothetical protein